MTEKSTVTAAQRARVARVTDAMEQLQRTVSAFHMYAQQPMAEVCAYYWEQALNSLPSDVTIVTVPQTEITAYNPEPENPDSGAQLLHLRPELDITDENIIQYGVPVTRVLTPKYRFELERLTVAVSDSAVDEVDAALQEGVTAIIKEIVDMARRSSNVECVTTPLQGSATLSSDGMHLEVFMYLMCGWRDATTKGPLGPA